MSTAPSADGKPRLLRITMYVKRKEGTSEEDFSKYWTERHAPLVSEWLARHGVVRYTQVREDLLVLPTTLSSLRHLYVSRTSPLQPQYHTPPSLRAPSEAAWPMAASLYRLPFDGAVELLVPDVACFQKARDDPFYKEKVQADEGKFFETGASDLAWTVGWEEVYVAEGKVLGGLGN